AIDLTFHEHSHFLRPRREDGFAETHTIIIKRHGASVRIDVSQPTFFGKTCTREVNERPISRDVEIGSKTGAVVQNIFGDSGLAPRDLGLPSIKRRGENGAGPLEEEIVTPRRWRDAGRAGVGNNEVLFAGVEIRGVNIGLITTAP